MKRGEIWWVNFDPSVGGEIRKKRPAVIISNDKANHYLNRVQVIPLTSKGDTLYPSETFVTFQGVRGKAMADQVTTVSKLRMVEKAGKITSREMGQIEEVVRIQLGM